MPASLVASISNHLQLSEEKRLHTSFLLSEINDQPFYVASRFNIWQEILEYFF